jgi:hypothetical protein
VRTPAQIGGDPIALRKDALNALNLAGDHCVTWRATQWKRPLLLYRCTEFLRQLCGVWSVGAAISPALTFCSLSASAAFAAESSWEL